jgi:hypothetical protein
MGDIYTAEVHHVRQELLFWLMMKGMRLFCQEKQTF